MHLICWQSTIGSMASALEGLERVFEWGFHCLAGLPAVILVEVHPYGLQDFSVVAFGH